MSKKISINGLQTLKRKIKETKKPWHIRARLIAHYHHVQVVRNKHWAVKDTADLLKLSRLVVQECLIISKALRDFPYLIYMPSRIKAIKALRDSNFDYFEFTLKYQQEV